jgi:pyruvate kinase
MEKGNASVVYIDYENISKVLKVGNRVFVDDGLISLIVTSVSKFIRSNLHDYSPVSESPYILLPQNI